MLELIFENTDNCTKKQKNDFQREQEIHREIASNDPGEKPEGILEPSVDFQTM